MPSIPNPIWRDQKTVPGVDDTQPQLTGCIYCAGDNVPPGTIFFVSGTSVCYDHIKDVFDNV